ncbi:MAG: Na(+)/H(+) antiporter subunit D [Deltaproteobacteria bacterium]|nr:MAG: Na(+)/H(+) antiporter subunit D [Deltaproteobacteria bacterium]
MMYVHPALIMIIGALLAPLTKGVVRKCVMVATPVIAFYIVTTMYSMTPGDYGVMNYLGFELITSRIDKLALVFLHVFTLMAIIGAVYALHVEDSSQHTAGFLYVAGSLGTTLAGDYLTLFVFWELMAVASTFLVWARREKRSIAAGYRYLLMHTFGGLVLLAGIFLRYHEVGSMEFTAMLPEHAGVAEYLILLGFALNAAMVPLHAWLPDAYPEATVTGAVFMCAFTTKTAVYVLARGFAGFELLAIMGAVMTLYGVGYAVIENNARRILAYHIISQVGYMVCGIGIGTEMAVNGAVAHAYAHILYKALLFMGVGAVLEMAGTADLSKLGGLYKRMPVAMVFTIIGGIAISGFPLTSGFVSKSMVIAGAGNAHEIGLMLMLTLAAVGTFLSVGIKLPYFIWFGKDSGVEPKKKLPWNMVVAMGIAGFFCIFIGVVPGWLYKMLPFAVDYQPYSAYHLSETFQLLGFTALGFYVLRKKMVPKEKLNLDLDIFYRRALDGFMAFARNPISPVNEWVSELYRVVGYRIALGAAAIASRFDVSIIDGVVDGVAHKVRETGDYVRHAQTGKLQQYIAIAISAFFLLVLLVANI